jgi:hypothetical protein
MFITINYFLNCSEVIVGTTKGSIFHYDFRGKSTLPVKTFRGSTGSVKSVSCITYLNQMHVMSISLDCHLRIHNFISGDLTIQVLYYLYNMLFIINVFFKRIYIVLYYTLTLIIMTTI